MGEPVTIGNATLLAEIARLREALNNIASGAACLPGYGIAEAAAEARSALAEDNVPHD